MDKFIRTFVYAFRGIGMAWKEERNMKIHTLAAFVALGCGFWFRIAAIEWVAVVFCICLVFSLEIVNAAIENLVDLVTPEHKPLAGKVKDLAAGAVLLAALGSVVVGCIIFRKYVFAA